MKLFKHIIIIIVTFLISAKPIHGQVFVEKSKEKVIISGKQYFIHLVKKGETAYSISKAYEISVQDLVKENPAAGSGVKVGQSLRIPIIDLVAKPKAQVKPAAVTKDESKYIYHRLVSGETVFALSRKFGVSEEEIAQSNPGIEINKMPLGYEIAIPKREFTSNEQKLRTPEKNIIEHKVEKGETLYSIAEKYGITARELRRENKGLMFPKVDDFVRVPVVKIAEAVIPSKPLIDSIPVVTIATSEVKIVKADEITPVSNLNGTFNVALMLPFYFEENSVRSVLDSSQTLKGKPVIKTIYRAEEWIYPESLGFIELYEGILLAADTLRAQGLNINLHVYDIAEDTMAVTRLIDSGILKDMDLIVGPVYSHNLSLVASYSNMFQIPVISPVPLKNNDALNNNPYLFKANPSLDVAQEAIAKRLPEFSDNNFVFIHSDSTHIDPEIEIFKNKIFRELTTKIPFEEIKFKEFIFYSRSNIDEDSINRLEHTLSDKTRNFIIIASEDPPMISECIANLKTLSKKFDIKLMGYPAMRELDNGDWKDYFDLGIELFSPFWIDYNDQDVKNFDTSFRKKFLTEPTESSYAWEGYDLAYYFLSGLAIHGKTFISNPDMHNPDLLNTSFQFRRKAEGSGFENQKLYLIKYSNDMEIKLLDKTDRTIK